MPEEQGENTRRPMLSERAERLVKRVAKWVVELFKHPEQILALINDAEARRGRSVSGRLLRLWR